MVQGSCPVGTLYTMYCKSTFTKCKLLRCWTGVHSVCFAWYAYARTIFQACSSAHACALHRLVHNLQGEGPVVLCQLLGAAGLEAFLAPDTAVFQAPTGLPCTSALFKLNKGWLFPMRDAPRVHWCPSLPTAQFLLLFFVVEPKTCSSAVLRVRIDL